MSWLLMGAFLVAVAMGVPLAFGMIISGILVVLGEGTIPLILIPHRVILGADSLALLAIPFFILAGNLMNRGGITDQIINFANALVGRFTGGLGLANIVASMLFAGVSGSAVADASALGSTLIPAMKKEGYGAGFSAAVTAASAVCGPIIPPSIPMVVYAIATGLSIGPLFLGGAIPGIILGLSLLVPCWIISKRRNYPKHEAFGVRKIMRAGFGAFWALLMPLIIIGGVLGGVMTVTESAAIAVVYSFFVGSVIYRKLKLKDLYPILTETALQSATIMIIVGMAGVFGWLMAVSGLPGQVASLILSISENPLIILLLTNILLLIVGTFMEAISAMLILIPVLTPVIAAAGIDLTHFGVVMVFNLMLGLLTPPVGILLFITARQAEESTEEIVKEMLPFLGIALAVLVLITVFPDIVMFLPNLLK